MLVGYARTSTLERTAGLEVQRRELATLGCGGCVCGANVLCRPRTVLDEALEFVRSGDTLVAIKLDQSAPSRSAPMKH